MGKVKGVKSVNIDVSKKQAAVTLTKDGKASLQEVLTAIKKDTTFRPSAV